MWFKELFYSAFCMDMIGQPFGERDDRQRWVRPSAGGKNATAGNVEIWTFEESTIGVDHTRRRIARHSGSAHMMISTNRV